MQKDKHMTMSIIRIYTLSSREIRRFFKVYHQTMVAPVTSALIFLSIFSLSIGRINTKIGNVNFVDFVGYGLIIVSVIQNSFANSSSSIIMSKVLGYISDLLVTPFKGYEIVISYVIGAVARGIITGILVAIALLPFVHYDIQHGFLLLINILNSSIFMGLLGVIGGLATNNFDQNSALTSYIIMPLSFLSGTFYSVKNLPIYFQYVNLLNPFFYIIDGFRYCLTDHSDGNIFFGIFYIGILNIFLFVICSHLFNIGWKIKS